VSGRALAGLPVKLLVAVACAQSAVALAALPPLAPGRLESAATVIMTGRVASIVTQDERRAPGFEDRKYQLRVRIESLEKLPKGSALSGTATVRGWSASRRPDGWTGPAGVHGLPAVKLGQRVRLFLKGSAPGSYDIVEPNGLEILAPR
jgi:hypothetical protein